MPSRLQIARPNIVRHFDGMPTKVLRPTDMARVLVENREHWRLAQSTNVTDFVAYLHKGGKLKVFDFPFPFRRETRYVWGDVPLLAVLATLKPRAYFCHYTALVLNDLTEQNPKTIYLNDEQPPKPAPAGPMEQVAIDRAFAGTQRTTTNWIDHAGNRIYLLNGKQTANAGVEERAVELADAAGKRTSCPLRVAGVERALIDATVRPDYSGGLAEVQKAFARAAGRASLNRLAALLKKIDYRYPYHQAIGFYLERSGAYPANLIDQFRRKFALEHDFHLGYRMGETRFDVRWRIHVPADF